MQLNNELIYSGKFLVLDLGSHDAFIFITLFLVDKYSAYTARLSARANTSGLKSLHLSQPHAFPCSTATKLFDM